MSQQKKHIVPTRLRFSQWSRKNWAVFHSLGREVSIGHIDVPVIGQALRKSSSSGAILLNEYALDVDFESDLEEDLILPALVSLLTVFLFSVLAVDLPSLCGEISLEHILFFNLSLTVLSMNLSASVWKRKDILLSIIYHSILYLFNYEKKSNVFAKRHFI
ncbi:hypothetical protein [Carboxylicivirga caseinilyticus]|uniref:hypothetical protein n=1 Tax=Carboxylicivirga caseinilyticus TaxID=3417572 RepID=UPI003D3512AA|nr:hypothetical protein [Marinilabiliaceae bacterium A049]